MTPPQQQWRSQKCFLWMATGTAFIVVIVTVVHFFLNYKYLTLAKIRCLPIQRNGYKPTHKVTLKIFNTYKLYQLVPTVPGLGLVLHSISDQSSSEKCIIHMKYRHIITWGVEGLCPPMATA